MTNNERMNMFLTNGIVGGAVDPARLRDWNNFVNNYSRAKSQGGK